LRKCAALAPGTRHARVAFLGMAEYELGDYAQALADILKGESIGLADRPAFVAAGALSRRADLPAIRRFSPERSNSSVRWPGTAFKPPKRSRRWD
jgi:hypothetical protein